MLGPERKDDSSGYAGYLDRLLSMEWITGGVMALSTMVVLPVIIIFRSSRGELAKAW